MIIDYVSYILLAYHALMLAVGRDDLRNRIPPRLYNFYTRYITDNKDPPTEGVVSWYKSNYAKEACQSQLGYVCQRPAASMSGSDGTGNKQFIFEQIVIFIYPPIIFLN